MKRTRDRRRPEAACDSATSCWVKPFQLDNVGNAKERKPFGRSISEKRSKKTLVQQREEPREKAEIRHKALKQGNI